MRAGLPLLLLSLAVLALMFAHTVRRNSWTFAVSVAAVLTWWFLAIRSLTDALP
jgi:hypothetical protein